MENQDLMKRTLLKYKNLLCNLTRRNKELYYKEVSSSLSLSKLVTSQETKNKEQYFSEFSPLKLNSPVLETLISKGKLSLTDLFKLNGYENPTLLKKIDKIRQNDNKYQKEFGISGGWFLGPFLLWKAKNHKEGDSIIISPIFKLPIDVEKTKGKKFNLVLEEDDLYINPTLKLYLENEYGVKLPDCISESSIERALETIISRLKEKQIEVKLNSNYGELVRIPPRVKRIKDENGDVIRTEKIDINEYLNEDELNIYNEISAQSFVIHDLFYVDHINASKMALYHDYDQIMEGFDHPLITELLVGAKVPVKMDKSKIRELDKYCERDNHFVVDIDSSQHLAIDIAKNERAIVIQGPPGTGKSQTITNLISQLLADNKKVLFISEKRAALDVVYQRLKISDLDRQSVIIHSSDLDRKELYTSFIDMLNETYDPKICEKWDVVSKELNHYKKQVSNYVEALKGQDEKSGLAIVDLFTFYSQFSKYDLNIEVSDYFSVHNFKSIEECLVKLSELQILIDSVPNYKNSLWIDKQDDFLLTERSEIELKIAIDDIVKSVEEISEIDKSRSDLFANGKTNVQLEQVSENLNFSDGFILKLLNRFRGIQSELETFAHNTVELLSEMVSSVDNYQLFSSDAELSVMKKLSSYYSTPKGFFDWFTPSFWRMRKTLKFYLKDKNQKLNLNKEIKLWMSFKENSLALSGELKENSLPKSLSESENAYDLSKLSQNISDVKVLVSNLNKIGGDRSIVDYDSSLASDLLGDQLKFIDFQRKNDDLVAKIDKAIDYLNSIVGKDHFNDCNSFEDKSALALLIHEQSKFVNEIESVNRKFGEIESGFKLKDFKSFYVNKLITQEDINEYVQAQAVKGWYDNLIRSNKNLQEFNSELHNEYLSKYLEFADKHKEHARHSVNNKLAKAKEETSSISVGGLQLLQKEANKQRRIKPPREIMEAGALQTMISMKKCWLMSPLSISQIMPNESGLFDVVIFDEASQVRVEDAIPSIYRGKSLIVVGDNKQMPPTNFFSGGGTDDDFDDEEDIELGESVLDQALKSYPDILLEWHYRSQAEALIAFSNYAFYGGRLIAPPNPSTLVKDKPISYVDVDNATFNSKHGNTVEAQLIVDEVVEILSKDPGASIGVISMGVSQQRAIDKLLDEAVATNKVFSECYEKAINYTEDGAFVGFFNKNLENVQGDERDYILISVGYAPNKAGGKLRKAFGPLSSKGGGRRLNVAVTRAKKRIKVFCSFDPAELESNEEAFAKNPDKTYFARYLNFAKAVSEERLEVAQGILNSFPVSGPATQRKPSRFNLDVKREIENLGYKVDTEIGSCGFYVDLGVEHPLIENSYVLGIECDGAMFHSTDYARDRDKARQALLESRGWKIHRIWSQDWSKNREEEINKIKVILEDFKIKQTA